MARPTLVPDSSPPALIDTHRAISDTSVIWPVAGFVFSLAAVLISQFGLDGAADSSPIFHWIQHGLLFGGGVGTGLTLNSIRIAGQRRA